MKRRQVTLHDYDKRGRLKKKRKNTSVSFLGKGNTLGSDSKVRYVTDAELRKKKEMYDRLEEEQMREREARAAIAKEHLKKLREKRRIAEEKERIKEEKIRLREKRRIQAEKARKLEEERIRRKAEWDKKEQYWASLRRPSPPPKEESEESLDMSDMLAACSIQGKFQR